MFFAQQQDLIDAGLYIKTCIELSPDLDSRKYLRGGREEGCDSEVHTTNAYKKDGLASIIHLLVCDAGSVCILVGK